MFRFRRVNRPTLRCTYISDADVAFIGRRDKIRPNAGQLSTTRFCRIDVQVEFWAASILRLARVKTLADGAALLTVAVENPREKLGRPTSEIRGPCVELSTTCERNARYATVCGDGFVFFFDNFSRHFFIRLDTVRRYFQLSSRRRLYCAADKN